MRTTLKRTLSLMLVVAMLAGLLLSNVTIASAAETADVIDGIGTAASEIKRDGPTDVDWTAKWIWNGDNKSMHNWLCMRKDVNLTSVPEKAEALISIDSRYWLWINGEMVVYEGGVKRGPNVEDSYYDTIDIAKYLKTGDNTIAVLGWYFGNDSDYYSYNSSGRAGFVFQADLGETRVVSDNTWKVHKEDGYLLSTPSSDPGSQPNYRLPEENIFYDGRLGEALEGWYLPSYDVSDWDNAVEHGVVGDEPWYDLWQRSIPMTKWSDILDYENPEAYAAYTTTPTPSAVNIGMRCRTNQQMQPYMEIEAPAGLKIEMHSDGAETVRSSYITKEGRQTFESFGWISTQTMTYKFPAGVKIIKLGYRDTGYNTEIKGSFSSDDAFFNQLWQESVDTLLITMRDTYMDCPDRERAQWWGDATNESHMTFYSLDPDSYLLYRKGVDTLINWRGQTGGMDDRVLATVVPINQGHFELPFQQLAGVVGFWTYYLYTGERDFLEQTYEPAVTYLTCWDMGNNGLVQHRPGSWDWQDWGSNFDVVVMENAWYYWACQRVLMMADELGIEKDNGFLISRMESIKAAYPSLWDFEKNAYYNSTGDGKADDRGNALAVLSGLADEGQYPAILANLTSKFNASPYMEKYVLDAMYAMDAQDEALDRMKHQYKTMMNDQWDTLWELFPAGGTHNHAWSGGPLINLSGNVAGVAPDTAGYDTYHVIPQLGYLNDVDCTVPTVKGDVVVSIDRADASYAMSLTSPANTVARVAVPRFEGQNTVVTVGDVVVFQDGKAAETVSGVEYLSNDAQYIYFNVQPGTWSFGASVKASVPAETYTVTLDATAGGYITVNGEKVATPYTASFAAGTELALEAVAEDKMQLTHWSGTYGFDTAKATLSVNDNVVLTANFAEKSYSTYKLVRMTAKDGCDIQIKYNGATMELPFTAAVKEGEPLTIEALDGKMWSFVNWEGDLFSADQTLTFDAMDEDLELVVQGAYKGSATGNVSLGAAVTVDDEYVGGSQWRASNLTDGVKLNDGGCTTLQWYSADCGQTDRPVITDGVLPEPAYLTVDLGKVKAFDTFRIYPRGQYSEGEAVNFMVDYSILVSNNGSDWETVYEKVGQENPGKSYVEISFEPQNARYIRLSVTKLGRPHMEGWSVPIHRLQLSELEVYNEKALPTEGTVTITGDETGMVKVNGVEQALPFTATYPVGTQVALEAVNATNYKFTTWSGDVTTTDPVLYLDVESDIDLAATFESSKVRPLGISENLAKGMPVTSSVGDIGGAWVVSNLTDGIVQMPGGNTGGFSTDDLKSTDLSANPVELTLDFGKNVDFNSVKFYPRNGVFTTEGTNCHFPTSFTVYVQMDGENVWREMQSFTDVTSEPGEPLEVKFDLQNARYMKIKVTKITEPASDEGGGAGGAKIYRVQFAEIEAYLSPLTPENLAIGGTVTSNNGYEPGGSWHGSNLTDGKLRSEGRNLTTGIKGYTTNGYASPELASPLWLNMQMPKAETANQVILYPRSDIDAIEQDSGITPNFPTKFDVQVKAVGASDYETVASIDYGSAAYNINGAPQVIPFGKDVAVTDVRIVCYRLGQPTWDEKTTENCRLQLAEMQVGFVPNANESTEDVFEGAIDLTPANETVVAENTAFSAAVTASDLADNGLVWSVENLDGSVSNVVELLGTTGEAVTAVPNATGEAYVVARMTNGLKTIARTKVVVGDLPEDPDPKPNAAVLKVTGADSAANDGDLSYSVTVSNVEALAIATLYMTVNEDVMGVPTVQEAEGWVKIIEQYENGQLLVVLGNKAGVTADADVEIAKVVTPVIAETGDATLTITKATLTAYVGEEGETYVEADLSQASATTKVEFSRFDVNRDGIVDLLDVTRAQRHYGENYPQGDVVPDGIIDIQDLILILNNMDE